MSAPAHELSSYDDGTRRDDDALLALVDPRYHAALHGAVDDVVRTARAGLRAEGCAVLPGFLRADVLEAARAECASVRDAAYFDVTRTNVYNTDDDPSLPEGHPARHFMDRTQAFVAKDRIPDHFVIARLHRWPAFARLAAACLEEDAIHPYADPLAGLVVNVCADGAEHPWHYDTNEYIVSMMVQQPARGGVFEYCPDIRGNGDENFPAVRGVLDGTDRSPVRALALRPGDLQLFRGRFSLHRVTATEGPIDRLTAIFGYAHRPGMIGKAARSRQLFGRTAPVHDGEIARGDALLD